MKIPTTIKIFFIGGFFWALIMYIAMEGFVFNLDLVWIYLVGGILWGLLTGFAFEFANNRSMKNYKRQMKVLEKRLAKGKTFVPKAIEFNPDAGIKTIEEGLEMWKLYVIWLDRLQKRDITYTENKDWYQQFNIYIEKVTQGNKLSMTEMDEIYNIVNEVELLSLRDLIKGKIMDIKPMVGRMFRFIQHEIEIEEIPDELQHEFKLLYYYIGMKCGAVDSLTFNDFVDKEPLLDSFRSDGEQSRDKRLNAIYQFILESEVNKKYYYGILVTQCVLRDIIQLYLDQKVVKRIFVNQLLFLAELYPFNHYLDTFLLEEYHFETGDFEKGIAKMYTYSKEISDYIKI